MLRALLWKELHEQRRLVVAACGIALMLPLFVIAGMLATTSRSGLRALEGVLPVVVMFGVWPVIAAATGAMAVASDTGDESLRFLLSRPVSRRRVWAVKLLAAAGALLVALAGSMGIAFLVDFALAGRMGAFWEMPPPIAVVALPIMLLFVSAHYCSLFLQRPLAAALAGAVVAGSIGVSSSVALSLLAGPGDLGGYGYLAGPWVGVPFAIVGVLFAAWREFRRAEVPGERGVRGMAMPIAVVTLTAVLLGAGPAGYAGLRADAAFAALHTGDQRLVDDLFVMPRRNPRGLSTALVVGSVNGDAERVVVPSGGTLPALSPDGVWLVYVAHAGLLGGAGDHHLRAVRLDGSDDRVISGPLPRWSLGSRPAMIGIAPDSNHVVFRSYAGALVTSIAGGPAGERRLELSVDRGAAIGWLAEPETPPELLYYRIVGRLGGGGPPDGANETDVEWGESLRRTELRALRPTDGADRLVRAFAGLQNLRLGGTGGFTGPRAISLRDWIPVFIRDNDSVLALVHGGSGEMIEITRTPCPYWGLSAARDRFLYGVCSGSLRRGDARAELRIRDLVGGTDSIFAVLEGYEGSRLATEAVLSPDGRSVLIHARRGYRSSWATHHVARGGGAQLIAAGFAPLAWRGDHEAVLTGLTGPRLMVVDVESGEKTVVSE